MQVILRRARFVLLHEAEPRMTRLSFYLSKPKYEPSKDLPAKG